MGVISKLDLDGKSITKYNNATISNINFNGTDYHFAKSSSVDNGICVDSVEEPIIDMSIYGNAVTSPSETLPPEYQRVEFLENTGTQYINTGHSPTSLTRFEVDYQITVSDTSKGIAGEYYFEPWATSAGRRFQIFEMADGKTLALGLGKANVVIPKDLERHIAILDAKNVCSFQDGVKYTDPNYSGDVDNNASIMLFVSNQRSFAINNGVRIFNSKIYEDDVLQLNMIPCVRKSDNVAGMYDTVNGTFFTNAGEDTFVIGASVLNVGRETSSSSNGVGDYDEATGKYIIPLRVNDTTTNIYLDEPLKKEGDSADYINYKSQKVVRMDGTTENIVIPSISTHKGVTAIEILTTTQPSKLSVEYWKQI